MSRSFFSDKFFVVSSLRALDRLLLSFSRSLTLCTCTTVKMLCNLAQGKELFANSTQVAGAR